MRLKLLLAGMGEDSLTESWGVCPMAAQRDLLTFPQQSSAVLCLRMVKKIRVKN